MLRRQNACVRSDRSGSVVPEARRHRGNQLREMFRGFSGYIQADARVIYDAVFRGEARANDDDAPPKEVGLLEPLPRTRTAATAVTRSTLPVRSHARPARARRSRPRRITWPRFVPGGSVDGSATTTGGIAAGRPRDRLPTWLPSTVPSILAPPPRTPWQRRR